ncbi:DUF1134 domain-containing protein [Hoeflea poritis]|uniref:EipA family protein n=1 Tax=Hoeflea poritis TaxID=2993659 RepID=A0ABT4VT38_9HYPH|nr:EipA family protein [Hoeflea poritis]MDA4847879.1 EipA family protein [Hoeflea poritis]
MNRTSGAIANAVRQFLVVVFVIVIGHSPAMAQQAQPVGSEPYTMQEIVDQGHNYFGQATDGLARVVERSFEQYGLPNGYVLGEEGSGAIVGGLTYGEGQLYTKNAGEHPVFWQGPSLGFDYGGQGSRVMMLVYELQSIEDIYGRFAGVSGQAYAVAGVGMTVLQGSRVVIVPIRTGIGARIGINIGYLKLTPRPTWNPF